MSESKREWLQSLGPEGEKQDLWSQRTDEAKIILYEVWFVKSAQRSLISHAKRILDEAEACEENLNKLQKTLEEYLSV